MKMNNRFRPEKCVSTDPERLQLCNPFLDVEDESMASSNGACLVSLPVTVDAGDVTGRIPVEAVKLAHKEAKEVGPEAPVAIAAKKRCDLSSGASFPRDEQTVFEWARVIPKPKDLNVTLCLNADLLKKMADAMGVGAVTLEFSTKAQGPIVVRPAMLGEVREFGILMPVKMPEKA
ncbi:MAG: hypothetical protein WC876_01680 [Candidatus Thermoplasmatota archaeon]|jgi:hypothetical protein